MEERRFDALAKSLARPVGRRGILKGIVGAVLGSVVASGGAAAQPSRSGRTPDDLCRGQCPTGPKAAVMACRNACLNCINSNGVFEKGQCCLPIANDIPVWINGTCTHICDTGYSLCGDTCCPDTMCCQLSEGGTSGTCLTDDPSACGSSCTDCTATAPANSTATCTGGQCGFACDTGYAPCGDACYNTTTECCVNSVVGTLENGVCTFTTNACAGTCSGTNGDQCSCAPLADGGYACLQGTTCADVEQKPCSTYSDCAAGEVCWQNNGCATPPNGYTGYCNPACDTCPGGSICGGVCTDTNVDSSNCGACGKACASGEVCQSGTCVNTNTNAVCQGVDACVGTPNTTCPTGCYCGTTVEGGGVCFDGNSGCLRNGGPISCTNSSDCSNGDVCVPTTTCADTACGGLSAVCVTPCLNAAGGS